MTEIKYDKILWQEFKGFLWYISCIFQRDSVVVVFFKRNLSITGVDFEIYICADIPSADQIVHKIFSLLFGIEQNHKAMLLLSWL